MFSRRLKTGYFAIEALNSCATAFFFYYFYFFMQKEFGFGNKANLMLAALNGATYACFAWVGGRFGQRFGYFNALKLGFGVMLVAQAIGWRLHTPEGEIAIMVLGIIGMSFTWPTLEALVSEGESDAGLKSMVGVYNVVWAAAGSVSYFLGGAILDRLGLRSLFYVPMAIQLMQLALLFWLEAEARKSAGGPVTVEVPRPISMAGPTVTAREREAEDQTKADLRNQTFQRLAWLANPFAYVALNTVVAVIPGVAQRLQLSTTLAGFCCSVWCFSRLAGFVVLWRWEGWHYRFRWLLVSYFALVGSFAGMLLAPNVAVLVLAQVLFGGSIALIYYSSLFYSMDTSETKGEHGGIHESAIGLGNFAGPAVGAAALQFFPRYAHSGVLGVTVLLLCGLGGLATLWRSGKKT